MLTQQVLLVMFDYNEETGTLRWTKYAPPASAGKVVGTQTDDGRLTFKFHNQVYRAENAVWCMLHGEWPETPIYFLNGAPADLRAANLTLERVVARDREAVVEAQTAALERLRDELVSSIGLLSQKELSRFTAVTLPPPPTAAEKTKQALAHLKANRHKFIKLPPEPLS